MSFGNFAESLIFNIASNVIKYRKNVENIQAYEKSNNIAGIYQEVTAFIWETVWFENLYYEGSGLTTVEQLEIE